GLQAEKEYFQLEGYKFVILGGSLHYFRVPREYWADRMLKMKALGLNTLTTYVPWNLHELQIGVYNFKSELDLEDYLTLAKDLDLWVILRPGPYICSELDLGGLPSWLLRDPNMRLRTTYSRFTQAVDKYFDVLMPKVIPHQYKNGGPIIAVQVENEYGGYNEDPSYMLYVKEALLSRGIVELLMTSDNTHGLTCGSVSHVTFNLHMKQPTWLLHVPPPYLSANGLLPKMVMEYWTGWFDHWGDHHHVFSEALLLKDVSLNLYMFHGGTNFGFINGAQDFETYIADVTSYDYDAPLSEAGDYTEKYFNLRQIFTTIIIVLAFDAAPYHVFHDVSKLSECLVLNILTVCLQPITSDTPINMENLPINSGSGQAFGYTLYSTVITSGGTLASENHVRDRAQVFVDGKSVGFLDYDNLELNIPEAEGKRKLSLLVENRGRVNYGLKLDQQRKGITGDIFLNDKPLRGFTIHPLEMKTNFIERLSAVDWAVTPQTPTVPGFFCGLLRVDSLPYDTFIKFPGWGKGVVFVNGLNLGRYWTVGPQQTLYLPAPWLHHGTNEIVIFEESKAGTIAEFSDTPDLGGV
uniref:Galactosidase beta 1 like 2 n=1 Tax=Callorhinchus milii TaxID=7868 RepID=A0A4W3H565_CALMI